MQIENVEFSDVTVNRSTGKCMALVTLSGQDLSSTLHAIVPFHDHKDNEDLRIVLFAEAFRQMSRMPEFRSGKRELTVGADVIPQKLSSAA